MKTPITVYERSVRSIRDNPEWPPSEVRVLILFGNGMEMTNIAKALCTSYETTHTQIKRGVLRYKYKTGIHLTRMDICRMIERDELVWPKNTPDELSPDYVEPHE